MSTTKILNEDWSEYDDRKKRGGSDRNDFACSESWEKDYLIAKIQKHYPHFTREQIKTAIVQCCESTRAPRPRNKFIECVISRLT